MATKEPDTSKPPATRLPEPDPAVQTAERELAAMRGTRLGGPFTQEPYDPTETELGRAARTGRPTDRSAALKGLTKYRTTAPMYRNGVLVPALAVIAVPDDEEPSITWEDAEEDAVVQFPFPPEPDTEEKQRARARRIEAQQRAERRAAEAAARRPEVMGTAIAAREAASGAGTPPGESTRAV